MHRSLITRFRRLGRDGKLRTGFLARHDMPNSIPPATPMRTAFRALVAFATLTCAACAGPETRDQELAWVVKLQSTPPTLGALSEAECTAKGGKWTGAPGAEFAVCERMVTDGGKPCSDHAECESFCVTTGESVEAGQRTTGVCARDYYHSDCVQGVSHGRAETILCRCG